MKNVWEQLKERKLVQWAVAYLAGAWLLLQVLDFLADNFGWSPHVVQVAVVLFGCGLIAVVILAWYHGGRGAQRVTAAEIALLTVVALAATAAALVDWRSGSRQPPPKAAAGEPGGAPHSSVAVLPFVNLSGDPNQEYFSDGITEELLTTLANVEGLRVPARTSAFSFKSKNADVREIGAALGVRHLLEGSVRKSGSRVKITAKLVNATDGYQVWSQTYDRELSDIFAIQEEIARAIVHALRMQLLPERQALLASSGTAKPAAYDAYLRGLSALALRNSEGFARAVTELERAIAIDPNFARAASGLAQAYYLMTVYGTENAARTRARARQHARRALQLDSTLGEPHAVLGSIAGDRLDWESADAHFVDAVRNEPGSALVHHWRGFVLQRLGRRQEAIAAAERAVEIDPLAPIRHVNLSTQLRLAGELERSLTAGRRAIELNPRLGAAYENLAETQLLLGHYDDAITSYERSLRSRGESPTGVREFVRGVAATRGAVGYQPAERERALQVVRTWEQSPGRPWRRSVLGVLYYLLDDKESMYRVWEAGAARGERLGFQESILFEPLQEDARYRKLLQTISNRAN